VIDLNHFYTFSRIRILPPLDEPIFSMLLLHVTAVLDPYPVGMHISITEAMMRGVPVVSAPTMQECTNSHAYGIAQTLGIRGPGWYRNNWPVNAEEYAVLAMQLQLDKSLRNNFLPPMNKNNLWSNPNGHKYRGLQMIVELAVRLAL
jgi:predicted O-linked N-acetylglucosamine transferase (SPINDLY family)